MVEHPADSHIALFATRVELVKAMPKKRETSVIG
jgi:hypothetical protein